MPRLPLTAAMVIALAMPVFFRPFAAAQSTQEKDAPAKESAPDVPDAIAVPTGLEPVLFVRAKGS